MERLLSCECGRQHRVAGSQAGQTVTCQCGKSLAVPTLRGLTALPPADPAPAAADTPGAAGAAGEARATSRRDTASRRWQGWRGPALAVTTAGLLIALAACGWFAWDRYTIDTSYSVEAEIEAGNQMFETYDPGGLSEAWHGFGKMGLRSKQPPAFFLWQLYAEDRERRALISGGVAALFAALAATIVLTAPRQR